MNGLRQSVFLLEGCLRHLKMKIAGTDEPIEHNMVTSFAQLSNPATAKLTLDSYICISWDNQQGAYFSYTQTIL